MVSGYFSGSTSTSASASGVTQPAQTFDPREHRGVEQQRPEAGPGERARPRAAARSAADDDDVVSGHVSSARGESEPQPLAQRQPDLFHRVGDLHRGKEIALEIEGALHVGLGEVERGRIAHEADERLGPMHDRRAHRCAVTEPDQRSVPQTERESGPDLIEDLSQNSRSPAGADVSWQRNHEVVMAGVVAVVTARH